MSINIRKKLFSIATTAQLTAMAIAPDALANNAKNMYKQYLSDLAQCSPDAIALNIVRQCENIVAEAVNWANSLEGKQYINSDFDKQSEFVYSIKLAYSGIDSLRK